MSPTEHDLRAALSDGEGGSPDPDRLIALGRARQARRRVQLISTAAVVAVVAGGGAGIVTLVRAGGGESKSSNAAAGGRALDPRDAAGTQAARAANSAAAGAAKAAIPAVGCPTTLPPYALPGGGSPGQFGADGPLFSKPVKSLIICSYEVPPGAAGAGATTPRRTSLTGARAARLAASLDDATAKPAALCPRRDVSATARNYAIIGLAADGTALPTVTVTRSANACADSQVTNGTAVRYNWTPPSDLLPVLGTPPSPPRMQGSPISS